MILKYDEPIDISGPTIRRFASMNTTRSTLYRKLG